MLIIRVYCRIWEPRTSIDHKSVPDIRRMAKSSFAALLGRYNSLSYHITFFFSLQIKWSCLSSIALIWRKHNAYVSIILVLLVVISITETRTASLPKSIPEAGLSIGDFDSGLQDRFRGAIQGGKQVVKEEGRSKIPDSKWFSKLYIITLFIVLNEMDNAITIDYFL